MNIVQDMREEIIRKNLVIDYFEELASMVGIYHDVTFSIESLFDLFIKTNQDQKLRAMKKTLEGGMRI